MPPVARTIKFTAPAVGEHEVPVPEGFLHADDIKETHLPKDHFEGELKRRVESVTKGLVKRDDLLGDEDFFKQIIEKQKDKLVPLLPALGIKVNGEVPDLSKLTSEITDRVTNEHVKPLQTKVQAYETEISGLRGRDLEAQVFSSASKLRVVPDLVDLVKIYVQGKVAWDAERKMWFAKNAAGDGFELSSDPKKGGHPYKTISELMEDISRDDEKKAWFETGTQPGAGFSGNNTDARGVTAETYQKMSSSDRTAWAVKHPEEFQRIMAEISQAGESKLFARR